jgi:hypothetical protein
LSGYPTGLTNADLRVWRPVVERFADVNVVNRVSHGGSGVMIRARISYGQQIQMHFIDANSNAQKYRDKILRPIVRPILLRYL